MIRVGVCDDDPLVLRLVADVIGRADDLVVVAVCRSGDEAIAVDEPVDVWLMDQRMPEMTGIQACAVLTAGTDPPRVLILTASTSETVSEAYRAGASGYLFKDEQPERLHTAVRAAAAGFQVQSPQAAVIIPRSRDAASPRLPVEVPDLAADERRIADRGDDGQDVRADCSACWHVRVRAEEACRGAHETPGRPLAPPTHGQAPRPGPRAVGECRPAVDGADRNRDAQGAHRPDSRHFCTVSRYFRSAFCGCPANHLPDRAGSVCGATSAVPTRSKELGLMGLRGLVVSVVAAGCVVGSETTLTRHSPSASLNRLAPRTRLAVVWGSLGSMVYSPASAGSTYLASPVASICNGTGTKNRGKQWARSRHGEGRESGAKSLTC